LLENVRNFFKEPPTGHHPEEETFNHLLWGKTVSEKKANVPSGQIH